MKLTDKKEKNREMLRGQILQVAKRLFLAHGYEATSMRKIASEMGFSPTAIYLYYEDKATIAYALQEEGFKQLRLQFSGLTYVDHPFERFKAMGRAYLSFAIHNPDFYELMFVMKQPMEYLRTVQQDGADGGWSEGAATFTMLMEAVTACQEIGYFRGYDAEAFAFMVWSTMHGLCTLNLHGHFSHCVRQHSSEDEARLLDQVMETFIKVLSDLK